MIFKIINKCISGNFRCPLFGVVRIMPNFLKTTKNNSTVTYTIDKINKNYTVKIK